MKRWCRSLKQKLRTCGKFREQGIDRAFSCQMCIERGLVTDSMTARVIILGNGFEPGELAFFLSRNRFCARLFLSLSFALASAAPAGLVLLSPGS